MSDKITEILECDYVVIGSGIAGLTSAAYMAHHGKSVVVLEKAKAIGGSSIISGGGFWSTKDYDALRETNPEGELHQARVIADNYQTALDWIKSVGTTVTPASSVTGATTFETRFAYIDIINYLNTCVAYIKHAGGHIVLETIPEKLLFEDGRVAGVRVRSDDGSVTEIRAPATLLATGGFQNNRELRTKYIGPQAADMLVRSNPNSTGDGMTLALEVGAGLSKHMDSWYGHTMPWPLNRPITERDYIPLAQFGITPKSIMLDKSGKRFRDESLGYYRNAQAVSRLPGARALVIFDEKTRKQDADISLHGFDRPAIARDLGAHVAQADTFAELAAQVAPWGYPGADAAIEEFNAQIRANDPAMQPPRFITRRPIEVAPFYAIEVQPAITYTHGGLKIDSNARVLTPEGKPIPALFAAGSDTGGNYHEAYAGGLSVGAVFGLQAAKTILGEIGLG